MQGNEPEVVLAIFPLLPVALGAVSAGLGAYGKYRAAKANQPQRAMRQKAFKQRAQTGYLKRYMADLRGRSADRARTELAMRPALRAIGAQQQKGQRQLAYQSAQQGLTGSGIEAQKQLALQQGTTQAVAGLGEKVLSQQLAQAQQRQAQKEGQRMKLAGEIARQEGAVGEANRMAEFRATEANRAAEHQYQQQLGQYDRNLKAARTNILTSAIGGGISAGMPYAQAAYKAKMMTPSKTPDYQQALTTAETTGTQYDVAGNPMSVEQDESGWWAETDPYDTSTSGQLIAGAKKGGRVTKDGIAQYYNGGSVEALEMAIPEITTQRKKREQELQTEFETATKEFGEKKTAFETAEAERKKKIEDANLLAQKQFEESEVEKQKLFETGQLESETERIAKIKSDYDKFETKEGKKQQAYEKELGKYDTKDKERTANMMADYDAYTGALKSQFGVEDYDSAVGVAKESPEFKMLEEKKNVLEKFNIGEEHYDKLRAGFESDAGADYETFSDYLQATKDEGKRGSFLKVNKRKKKKLLKKYAKQQGKMMPDEFRTLHPKYPRIVKPEEVEPGEFKIKDKLVAEDLPEYQPGEAPTPEEYTAQEFTGEAPTLQQATPEELQKMQTREIYKQLVAGIDVQGNIAKAKTNREATDFFKQFSAGNMTTDQIWAHPYSITNPAKIATLISTQHKAQQKTQLAAQKLEDKQFADREKVRDNITQSLFDIDQISASGDPITADDPDTPDVDESKTATYGEDIKGIVDANPDGVTPDQMREILGYVDKIKAEYGDEDDGISFGEGFDETDPMGSLALLIESGGTSTKKVTKLLKELLKLPILPAEGMLAEQREIKGVEQKLGDMPKLKEQKLGDMPKGKKEEFTW